MQQRVFSLNAFLELRASDEDGKLVHASTCAELDALCDDMRASEHPDLVACAAWRDSMPAEAVECIATLEPRAPLVEAFVAALFAVGGAYMTDERDARVSVLIVVRLRCGLLRPFVRAVLDSTVLMGLTVLCGAANANVESDGDIPLKVLRIPQAPVSARLEEELRQETMHFTPIMSFPQHLVLREYCTVYAHNAFILPEHWDVGFGIGLNVAQGLGFFADILYHTRLITATAHPTLAAQTELRAFLMDTANAIYQHQGSDTTLEIREESFAFKMIPLSEYCGVFAARTSPHVM